MFSTRDFTKAEKAEPIIIPTAISTTLPFTAKLLKSDKNFFIIPPIFQSRFCIYLQFDEKCLFPVR